MTKSVLFRRSALAVLLAAAVAVPDVQAEVLEIYKMQKVGGGWSGVIDSTGKYATFSNAATYDGLTVKIEDGTIGLSQYTVYANAKAASLTINGDTNFYQYADKFASGEYDYGNYAITAMNGGSITLNGNIDMVVKQSDAIELDGIGCNAIYSRKTNSLITVGKAGGTTRIWAIGNQPDVISAKDGGTVKFVSTNNQIVGNIDMMDRFGNPTGVLEITFSGEDAYWFGDEQTFENSYNKKNSTGKYLSAEDLASAYGTDIYSVTIENGAQYSYFGLTADRTKNGYTSNTITKRLSEVTLQNGGVINLYETSVKEWLSSTGLDKVLHKDQSYIDHNYIRIGNLKGTGGIFRLDLDVDNKAASDMIFIEGSTTGGQHEIEPYNLANLTNITPENTLRFATVAKDSGVTFKDKQNVYGESLYDYELEIGHEAYSADDSRNAEYMDRIAEDDANFATEDSAYFDITDFEGGTNWFIKRIVKKESSSTVTVTDAGHASYDAIVAMDSYRDRASELERGSNGLWVRYRHGSRGVKNRYSSDFNTVTVGGDAAWRENVTSGAAFSYTDTDADFSSVTGTNDLKGYEGMVYTSFDDGTQYLDLVGRFGRVNSKFSASSDAGITTHGKYHTNYGALSAEYGYKFRANENVFLEPQAQLQYARLGSSDYRSERGVATHIKSADSLIGRVGLRAGFEQATEGLAASGYFTANILHQFTDGQDAKLTAGTDALTQTWGDKGTWYSVGLAANVLAKDKYGFQLAVTKEFGGDTDSSWFFQAKASYRF